MTPEEVKTALLRQSREIETLQMLVTEYVALNGKYQDLTKSAIDRLAAEIDQITDRIETLETKGLGANEIPNL